MAEHKEQKEELPSYMYCGENGEASDEDPAYDPEEEPTEETEDDDDLINENDISESQSPQNTHKKPPQSLSELSSESQSPTIQSQQVLINIIMTSNNSQFRSIQYLNDLLYTGYKFRECRQCRE